MPVLVVATVTPKPGAEDAVREALLRAIPQVHGEPGCGLYALHEGDSEFVMVERWESAEALQGHSAALTRPGGELAGEVTGPRSSARSAPSRPGMPRTAPCWVRRRRGCGRGHR